MWGLYNQNLGLDQILDSGKVLSYAFKWLSSKQIVFRRHTNPDFLNTIWDAINEADAIITFNGRRHDIPLLNREFIKAGKPPPSPFTHIDLIETAKKHFKFSSNKLDNLLQELGLGKKLEHEGFPLWIKVVGGDEQAWKVFEKYNVHDVRQTEKLYKRLLPWITSHPNHALYTSGGPVCPNCGSRHLHRRGTHKTLTQLYERFQCQQCGKWSRGRYTVLSKENKSSVLTGA